MPRHEMTGPLILNLGCGARTHPRCVNIDWSVHLRIARSPLLLALARLVYAPERVRSLEAVRSHALRHDLTKGIPFPDGSADAVYQSYFLPTIDRDLANPGSDGALRLLKECRRVLKRGGVLRVVVPDFEAHCRSYLDHIDSCRNDPARWTQTDERMSHVIGLAVLQEAGGSRLQLRPLRALENLLLGDARARGQTHRWDYDRYNLSALLERAGFSSIQQRDFSTSGIPGWDEIGLDRGEGGSEYKTPSLYLEAIN